jgi:5-methylcytosine-specific restriction endonuclease McrA
MPNKTGRGPKAPPGVMRERVRKLLELGWSRRRIAQHLGVSKSTVVFHASRLDAPIDPRFGRRYRWTEIQAAYDRGMSRLECMDKFGFSAYAWTMAVKRGAIVQRPKATPLEELLVKGRRTNRSNLKKRLIEEGLKENRCEICGITRWMGKPVSMQLHHKNGDGSDNRLPNLELLCGTCHSQTDTYGAKNANRHLTLVEPLEDDQKGVA